VNAYAWIDKKKDWGEEGSYVKPWFGGAVAIFQILGGRGVTQHKGKDWLTFRDRQREGSTAEAAPMAFSVGVCHTKAEKDFRGKGG